MSERTNRVRLSDKEKRIVDMTRETVYDGTVPRGVVIARACRALLAEDTDDESDDAGVVL